MGITFRFLADVELVATSIDDALAQLGKYYTELAEADSNEPVSGGPFIEGNCYIYPSEEL